MGKIDIVGLGPGNINHLTLGVYKLLKNSKKVFMRTTMHPIINDLVSENISIESFDKVYDESENFEEVYNKISVFLIEECKKNNNVVYAVPGHPLFAEKTVEILLKMLDNRQEEEIDIEIHSSMSFLDVVITSLKIDPVNGLKIINAMSIKENIPDIKVGNIITQVYDRFIASEVKLNLLEIYDDEKEIYVVSNSGITNKEKIKRIYLYELDRLDWIDYLTSVYIPPDDEINLTQLDTLLSIMDKLRSENGCPWDREQTHTSLRKHLIEEVHEVIEAVEKEDYDNLVEELGDVLLQIIFHCQIGKEENSFNIKDVIKGINEKLIYRHPHVFKKDLVEYSQSKWEELKKEEKGIKFQWELMESIPKSLPILYKAEKVQKKASDVGFDWDNYLSSIDKIIEECVELKDSLKKSQKDDIIEEAGDVLFSIVNVCRHLSVDPEEALNRTIKKFITRFKFIEKELYKRNINIKETDINTLDELWEISKEKR